MAVGVSVCVGWGVTVGGAAAVARVVSATDFRDLARTIVELLTDEQARQSLSIRGRESAQEFSWKRTAALTREVYEQALR
jgi:glycosyltransferase involved in cell wall biosynthesis